MSAQTINSLSENFVAVCKSDYVAQILHCQSCYSPVECGTVSLWDEQALKVHEHALRLNERLSGVSFVVMFMFLLAMVLAMMVSLGVGGVETFRPEEQLCGEFLIVVAVVFREQHFSESLALENISADSRADVVVAHVLTSRHRSVVGEWCLNIIFVSCAVEVHNVRVVVAYNVKAVLVWSAQDSVIAVDELDELCSRHT